MSTRRFQLEAGALVRGGVIRALKNLCWENDIQCSINEDKGFVTSVYYIELRHEDDNLLDCAIMSIKDAIDSM